MEEFKKILKSFQIKEELNSDIWNTHNEGIKMKSEIRERLLTISNLFIEYIGFDIFVQDITMTGSLANYNWSEFSDIDIHIMFDFDEAKEQKDLYSELFKLRKTLFNSIHNITIKGHDVELYVQDTQEPHISTGVYSVLYDEWIEKPNRGKVTIDEKLLETKIKDWTEKIENIVNLTTNDRDLSSIINDISILKEKIKNYRNAGLKKDGEYSYENIVFKFLRRSGLIQKLFDFENTISDTNLSILE